MWNVYFVKCKDGSLYTGISSDIERRLAQHNGLLAGGARYTAARRPVELVYVEQAEDRSAASKREYVLRKLTRAKKLALADTYLKEQANGSETAEAKPARR